MSSFVGQQVRTELAVVALLQDLRVQLARAGKLLHVVTVALNVPLQLGEGQIVSLKREETGGEPTRLETWGQAVARSFRAAWTVTASR